MSKQGDEIVSRRKILTGGGLLAGSAAFVAGTGLAGTAKAQGGTYTEANARQEVEYLRRWYGVATDLLGFLNSEDPTAFNEGRKIYRRIFTPDALISINGTAYVDPLWVQLRTSGPISFIGCWDKDSPRRSICSVRKPA